MGSSRAKYKDVHIDFDGSVDHMVSCRGTDHEHQKGFSYNMDYGYNMAPNSNVSHRLQYCFRQKQRLRISSWPLVVPQTTDINMASCENTDHCQSYGLWLQHGPGPWMSTWPPVASQTTSINMAPS